MFNQFECYLIEIEEQKNNWGTHKIMSLINVDLMTIHESILVYILFQNSFYFVENSCNTLTKTIHMIIEKIIYLK